MHRIFSSPKKTGDARHRSKERGRKFGGLRRSRSSSKYAQIETHSIVTVTDALTRFLHKYRTLVENLNRTPSSSYWVYLPVEIQVSIFAQCSVHDFLPLRLVCRGFHEILAVHELVIAQEYLQRRRHGTLPSTISHERTYTMNPEDDVVLLSDLFPPSKSAKGGYLYTFRYLHSLRRRQTTCARLSRYLANRVMDRFLTLEQALVKNQFPSRVERNLFFDRGIAHLQFNITPLTYCVLYFLEAYASARKEHLNHLLREYEAGRLPVPIPSDVRSRMYAKLQTKILRSPPFTDTSTLIATHHCMHLLVSYLRHTLTLPPGQFGTVDDHWIGGLLTISGFARIAEYFSAEIGDGDNLRAQRRDFMINFDRDVDINSREEMHPCVYLPPPSGQPHYSSPNEVWFDVVYRELRARNAVPHDPESFTVCDGLPVLVGCDHCREARGWMA